MARSGQPPTIDVLDACKQPGSSCDSTSKPYGFVKGYTFLVKLVNPESQPIYLYTPSSGTYQPYFNVTSSVPFSFATARYFNITTNTIGAAVGSYITIGANSTIYIIISAGTGSASPNSEAAGRLCLAWGHTTTAGADPDHPYTPAPTPTGTPGVGWVCDNFSFTATPPCGTDCVPGGDTTAVV